MNKPNMLDLVSVRSFDTKRTLLIKKGGEITLMNDANLDAELTREGMPILSRVPVADMSDAGSSALVNSNSVYKVYPEKNQSVDYTSKVMDIAKNIQSPGRKLVGRHIATSYGYVNFNHRLYHVDSIEDNAKTFYQPNPIPFCYDHDTFDSKKVIGRVFFAAPVHYQIPKIKMNDIRVPKSAIQVYSIITDQDAIDGILGMRYLTISSGFRPNIDNCTCSICGEKYKDCDEHIPGNVYEGKLAYTIVHDMRYKDVSYVSAPADLNSKNISWELMEGDALADSTDHIDRNKLAQEINDHNVEYMFDNIGEESDIGLYMIDGKSNKTIVDLFDLETKDITDMFGNKWKCEGDVCQLISNADSVNQQQLKEIDRTKPIVSTKKEQAETTQNDTVNDNIKVEGDCDYPDMNDANSKEFAKIQLALGTEVETEHEPTYMMIKETLAKTGKLPDPEVMYASIATDHLNEIQDYYTRLEKMEEEAKEEAEELEEKAETKKEERKSVEKKIQQYKQGDSMEDDMKTTIAAFDMIQPLLEDNNISVESAIDYLKESGVAILINKDKLPTSQEMVDLISEALVPLLEGCDDATTCGNVPKKKKNKSQGYDSPKNGKQKEEPEEEPEEEKKKKKKEEDAKLSTAARKRLSKSTFCGPNRSFPVPDCAHVTAARRLIGRYKGPGDKSRILACVNRKAKAMGCDK